MSDKKTVSRRKPLKSGLTQAIYEGLREEITTGKLRPGELLSRRTVAARYGTSYIAVIEAMARLEHTGLIEVEARQAARVSKINVEAIRNAYVLREAYETQAIRLACETATAAQIKELYRLAEAVDSERPAPSDRKGPQNAGAQRHGAFHLRIAEISGSAALVQELHRTDLLQRLQRNWYYAPEMVDPPCYHSLLVDTIVARDPTGADAVMRAHVRAGLEKELLGYQTFEK